MLPELGLGSRREPRSQPQSRGQRFESDPGEQAWRNEVLRDQAPFPGILLGTVMATLFGTNRALFSVLSIESRASCTIHKGCTAELYPQPASLSETGFHQNAQVGLELVKPLPRSSIAETTGL